MTLREIIRHVSEEVGLPQQLVLKIYRSYWKAIRSHITSLPLKDELTDEEFLKLQPNINIPSIGKLTVTLDRYKRVKKFNHILKDKKDVTHNKH